MDSKINQKYRSLLQKFYSKVVSKNPYHHLYNKMLSLRMDEAEEQPVHEIQIIHQASKHTIESNFKAQRNDYVYQSKDFGNIFLYSYFFYLINSNSVEQLHEIHNELIDKVSQCFGSEGYIRYRECQFHKIDYIFETLQSFIQRKDHCEIFKLYALFYEDMFDTLWMKRMSRNQTSYESQACKLLKFLFSEEGVLAQKDEIQNVENYLNKFGCSIVIIDENTKMQERHGTGEGKEYRFYLNSMNFYQVREEDLMVRKDNKDKIKSATVSKLLLSFDNMMQKHSRNTYQLCKYYNIENSKTRQPESARLPQKYRQI